MSSEQPHSACDKSHSGPTRPFPAHSNIRLPIQAPFRNAPHYWQPTAIALLAATALWAGQFPSLDDALTSRFFDRQHMHFPLADHWLWSDMFDSGIKWLTVLLWSLLVLLWVRSLLNPPRRIDLKRWRAFLLFTVTASLASLLLTLGLRDISPHACPVHLQAFGGTAGYAPLFSPNSGGPGSGGCLPSGHAAAAFMWIAVVYASHRWEPEWFRPLLIVVSLSGLLVGAAEILSGRHFLSQVLATASICWLIPWAYAHWWPNKRPATADGQTPSLAGQARPASAPGAPTANSPSLIR